MFKNYYEENGKPPEPRNYSNRNLVKKDALALAGSNISVGPAPRVA